MTTNTTSNPAGSPTIVVHEPTQKSKTGLEIPVPSKDQIMGDFEKIATANSDPQRRGPEWRW